MGRATFDPSTPPQDVLAFARALDRFGRRWNRYRIEGLENLPAEGPALLVLYHGFLPIDGWYFSSRLYLQTGRHLRSLADRFLFKVPGLGGFITRGGSIPGEREPAIQMLKEGNLVLVSPGGVREALVGKEQHYQVVWGDRLGFAKVALAAGAPLIPLFTENIEESYRSPYSDSRPLQAFYEATRWPLVAVVGLGALPFPVPLTTWIGEPVVPRPGETPESLKERTRVALQALMDAHQRPRPRLPRALLRRLRPPEG